MQRIHLVIIFVLVIAILCMNPGLARYGFVAAAAVVFTLLVTRAKSPPAAENYTDEDLPGENKPNANILDEPAKPTDVYEASNVKPPADEHNPYPWMSNPKYTSCYAPPPMDFNGCNLGSYLSYDEANAKLAAMRSRDKRSLDGAVTKNVNYFRKNFGHELDRAENERWWGNSEY